MQPQFNLHALTNPSNPGVVLLGFPCCSHRIELKLLTLRLAFFLANLVVLAAAVMSFQAWIDVDAIKFEATKGLSATQKGRDPLHVPHRWTHDHYSHNLAHGFAHADQIMFASGVLLMCYYVVYGFVIPLKFGSGITDLKFSVLGFPPILIVALDLLFTAMAFINLRHELNIMDCDILKLHTSYMRLSALVNFKEALNTFCTRLCTSLALSGVLMIIQGLLPFFLYDLPFQRKMDVDELVLSDDTKVRTVKRYKDLSALARPVDHVIPYRNLSAAYTVMLQLVKPEIRDYHRSL